MDSKYRVIEIIDKYSIIINYGHSNGAKKDDQVRIISKGPEIIDPLNGEILGSLDAIKAELTIATIYERFSICKNIELTKQNVLINPFSKFEHTTQVIHELNIDPDSESKKRAPDDLIIKIGDIVEII